MHGHEKSGPVVVVMKPANKGGQPPAELVERRAGAEGNVNQREHAPGAEPGKRDPGAGSRTACRKAKEEGTVHRALAPRQRRYTTDGIPRAEARCRPRRGWRDVDGLRGRPRAEARGAAWPGPPRRVSAATVPPGVYTEGGRQTAAAGDRRTGGQDSPGRDRHGAECDLRGRLPRVLVWVPTRAWPA